MIVIRQVTELEQALWHLGPRADGDEGVRLRPQAIGGIGRDSERVVLGDDATPAAEGCHRRVHLLGQRAHGLARMLRAAPVMIIGRAAAATSLAAASTSSGEGAAGLGRAAGPSGSTKALDAIVSQAISIATGPGRPDSICRKASLTTSGASAGRLDARGPFGQRAQGGELIGQLVQVSAPTPQKRRRHLAGDAQDGRAAAKRRAQGGRGVEHAPGPGTTA